MSNVLVLGEGKLRRYVVFAHKKGAVRPMVKYFPICSSENEAMQRVFVRALKDPAWAERYRGWTFVCAEYANSVQIGEDGIVRRCS